MYSFINLLIHLGIECLSFLLCFLHSFHSCLMSPSKQTRCVNVRVGIIFIIADLQQYNITLVKCWVLKG